MDSVRGARQRIPLGLAWYAGFTMLSLLCLAAHELVHHVTVRAVCGEWGTMTFYTFHLPAGCEPRGTVLLATLAGPVLTYALMYWGVALIRGGRALAGATLILANLPLARFVTVLMRGGDEMVLGRALIGGGAAWLVLMALTIALLAAPVVHAWRAILNRRRAAIFALLLIAPLFVDMLIKRFLLARALEAWPAAIAGVPLLFMAYVVVLIAALATPAMRRTLWPAESTDSEAQTERVPAASEA